MQSLVRRAVRPCADAVSRPGQGRVAACSRPGGRCVTIAGRGFDRGNRMGCLFVLMAAFAPRLLVIFAWIARPTYVDAVFDTWIFPLLGLIFLPFTTLIYLFLGAPPQGIEGLDWLWIALAVLLDLSHYANTYSQRDAFSRGSMGPRPPTASGPPMR